MCGRCGRYGRYNVKRLIAARADAKLPDLLAMLADCPNARSVSIHNRCKAVYHGLHCGAADVVPAGAIPRRPQATDQRLLPLRRQ
jgi:hypothetical protein